MPVQKSDNFEEAVKKLTNGGSNTIILQTSDATGDISHVAPLLGTFAHYGVLVYKSNKDAYDKKNYIPDTYIDEYKISSNRVAWVDEKIGSHRVKNSITLGDCTQILISEIRIARAQTPKLRMSSGPLVNKEITRASKDTAISNIKAVLRGPKFCATNVDSPNSPSHAKDPIITDYLVRLKVLDDLDKNWVVIWGRISREIHVSANSSTPAIAELAQLCLDAGYGVIIAGDVNFSKIAKYDADLLKRTVNIGQFWKKIDDPVKDKARFIPENTEAKLALRPDQVRLFYVLGKILKARGKYLVHVGMRSGGLDAYAFSGQRTLYLLPEGYGDDRMEEALEGLKGVKGFNFEKETLQTPVTNYRFAPNKSSGAGHPAFVKAKGLNQPYEIKQDDGKTIKITGPEKMKLEEDKKRLTNNGWADENGSLRVAFKGFAPGDAPKALERIKSMMVPVADGVKSSNS